MRKIDRRIIMVFALIFIVGMAYGLMKFLIAQKEEPPMRPNVAAQRFVKAEPVSYGEINSPVSEEGRMSSVSEVDIISEASGRILMGDIPLKRGARFNKGQMIFSIYSDEAELALQSRKSQFLNTLANLLPDIKVDYPAHEKVFMEFFNSVDFKTDLPEFPVINDDKLKVFLASRNVQSEYFSIKKDELQLKRFAVYAPFDGTLAEVYLEVGSYSNTGGRVAHAIRTDRLEMEVPLKRIDADWVKIGDPVRVISKNTGHEWAGKVIRKAQMVDENTQRRGIYVQLEPQKGTQVLVGEYLFAEFPGRTIEGAMEIPRNAVFNSNEVFVVKDGRLVKKFINIIKTNESTLIFNGLEEGQKLVVQPMINVLEGTPVSILGEDEPVQQRKGPGSNQGGSGPSGEKTGDRQQEKADNSKRNNQ
jgi:multidrug efflux pump subunit AcrA (membrane-fusion protein)